MTFTHRLGALITGGILLAALPAHADEIAARKQAARTAAGGFVQELGAALRKEMQQGGPDQAILVCRDLAPQIAGELSRANGWQVKRVGTRVRNPMLGMPDAWEREVLNGFEERAAAGEPFAEMEFAEVVEIGGAEHFRYLKAIPTQEACLTCHGAAEQITAGVKAKLETTYPHDRATGYLAGQLRGAISITQPLDIPLTARDAAN